jgi:uncharacterized repeat protein (TIGR01451 family)
MRNSYWLLWLGVLLMSAGSVAAQRHKPIPVECAVPTLTTAQRQILEQQAYDALIVKKGTNATFTSITYVPIRPHILRKSNGTGGMSLASINQVIAITNTYYLLNGYGIQFYLAGTAPDYVDNDAYYTSYDSANEDSLAGSHDVTNALNQYYVNNFSAGIGGYAYYPANNIYSTRSFILNEDYNLDDMGNRLVPHELGHTFNLIHTFGDNNGTAGTTELVTRGAGANCSATGDLLCDTPADPYGKQGANLINDANGCPIYNPNSTARDANNALYSPSVQNIMSYYFPCTHNFTAGQYDRMQAGLALRQSHTAYSLNYPPTLVLPPSNVAASLSNNQVILTWQDNGTNEMGYFIERSLSPSSGFVLIGGVGPNTTTFTDTKTTAFTTYYYRVKPSNSTTTGMSPTASVTTATCHPTYGNDGCNAGDGLNGFVLNGVVISQNTGCSASGYSASTAVSTNIAAGNSYAFTGTLLTTTESEGVTIWADLNHNRVFEVNQGELLYQSPIVSGQFSGALTFPASLTTGKLDLRIIVAYNVFPTDPCGNYNYGETEDYVLNVVNSTDLSLSLQTSSRTVAVNQPVSYSLTIRNDGPFDATGIQWQNRLPPNLVFVSAGTGVTSSSTAVSGTNSISLAAGQSTTVSYLLRPTQPGIYSNAAQIMTSDQLDPDSQPGSGTDDGQDDAATVDMRTPDSSTAVTAVYRSPNPNQIPLPPVLSSQPPTDPAKADLSLAMTADKRTPRAGQPATFTITITNAGGITASNIVVRDTLRGLTFTSSPTGMSVVSSGNGYTIIEGKVASLTAGTATQLVFVASTTAVGYLLNAAQIWSADTLDPDSTPGSVTPNTNNLNGEDDVALIDLRVGTP